MRQLTLILFVIRISLTLVVYFSYKSQIGHIVEMGLVKDSTKAVDGLSDLVHVNKTYKRMSYSKFRRGVLSQPNPPLPL